jgi:chromosome partitioning protein
MSKRQKLNDSSNDEFTNKELFEKFKIKIVKENIDPKKNSKKNPKIISFYAEKGGVGKTTLTLTLAHVMAAKGHRVLIYDCDTQRSLTTWIFGNNIESFSLNNETSTRVDSFIESIFADIPQGFKKSLTEQILKNDGSLENDLSPAYAIKIKENLFLVSGSRRLLELDNKIYQNEYFADAFNNEIINIPLCNKVSGKIYHAIEKTAKCYDIDYVFLDMNPYPGALNRCLVMSSHYLIVPARLDYYSQEMMYNLKTIIREWNERTTQIKKYTVPPWPNHSPKFLGFIANIFSNQLNLTSQLPESTEWLNPRN